MLRWFRHLKPPSHFFVLAVTNRLPLPLLTHDVFCEWCLRKTKKNLLGNHSILVCVSYCFSSPVEFKYLMFFLLSFKVLSVSFQLLARSSFSNFWCALMFQMITGTKHLAKRDSWRKLMRGRYKNINLSPIKKSKERKI